ncbi:hypothetical protein P7H12_02570 [Paenibacillus larvae]|nr:hypothetical protein [Paenibacillus larvae]MDT2262768.1 hypothetical protein [Paenibacillus larvae]
METKIIVIEDKVDRIIPSIVSNAVTQIISDLEKGIADQQQASAQTQLNMKVESKELAEESEHKPTPLNPTYRVMRLCLCFLEQHQQQVPL